MARKYMHRTKGSDPEVWRCKFCPDFTTQSKTIFKNHIVHTHPEEIERIRLARIEKD